MRLFGGLFFTAFFFSIFIFNENTKNIKPKRAVSSVAHNSSFDTLNFRRSYISLSEEQTITGLSYRQGNVQDYMRRVFGTLIQKSHDLSINNLPYTDGETSETFYNTFLLLSLQVPMHESNLSHFRRMKTKDYCYFSNDVLDPIYSEDYPLIDRPGKIEKTIQRLNKLIELKLDKKNPDKIRMKFCKNSDYKKSFKKKKSIDDYNLFNALCGDLNKNLTQISNTVYLYDGIKALNLATGYENNFKHCSKLNNKETVNQLFFSNDYADVGMMMFNAPSHPDVFANGLIYDLDFVMEYGLDYLIDGFQIISNYIIDQGTEKFKKRKGFECFEGIDSKLVKNKTTMMKGAWSGKYNSGGLENSCRFTDTNLSGKYKLNDENFDRTLARVLYKYEKSKKLKIFFDSVVWRVGEKLSPSILHKYLPEESIEYKAYEELIDNVVNGVNNSKYLSKVLHTNYDETQQGIKKEKPLVVSEEDFVVEQFDVEEELTQEKEMDSIDHVTSNNKELSNIEAILKDNEKLTMDLAETEEKEQYLINKNISEGDEVIKLPVKEIPIIKKEGFVHYTFGVDINIRTTPVVENSSLCANTRDFGNTSLVVESFGQENSFYKVKFEKEIQEELLERCHGYQYFYLHKSIVRKSKNSGSKKKQPDLKEEIINSNVYIISDRKLRSHWGMSKSIVVGRISANGSNPVLILITNKKEIRYRGKSYMWYEFVHKDGKKVWFSDSAGSESTAIRGFDE